MHLNSTGTIIKKTNLEWFDHNRFFSWKIIEKQSMSKWLLNVNQSELYLEYVVFDGLWTFSFESYDLRTEAKIFPKLHLTGKRNVHFMLNCIKHYWFWSSQNFHPHFWKRSSKHLFSGGDCHWVWTETCSRLFEWTMFVC